MSFFKKLGRIGIGVSKILVDKVVIPWYGRQTGDVVERKAEANGFAIRHEVARKTHEGLARSVWRYRRDTEVGALELIVEDVEAATLEDGEYILIVSLLPRNPDLENENYNPNNLNPMPLHMFLENFLPVGEISEPDYDS